MTKLNRSVESNSTLLQVRCIGAFKLQTNNFTQNTSLWGVLDQEKQKYPKTSGSRVTFYFIWLINWLLCNSFAQKCQKTYTNLEKNCLRLKMQGLCVAQTMVTLCRRGVRLCGMTVCCPCTYKFCLFTSCSCSRWAANWMNDWTMSPALLQS